MADIPVERKEGGFPWWLIPLILLLLLLPLFFLMRGCNNGAVDNTNTITNQTVVTTNAANRNNGVIVTNNSVGGTTTVVTNANNIGGGNSAMNGMRSGNLTNGASTAGTSSSGETITDVNYFGGASDKSTLVGRGVTFSGVRVNRVVSDRVFTVKSGSGEMYVMLDDSLNSGGMENQIKIKSGQNVNLGGAFRNVPTAEVKDEAQNRDLNAKNYAQMKNQKVYLHATSVSDAR